MDFNEYVNRGVAFFQEGKNSEALKDFEMALEIQPGNADVQQLVELLKMKTQTQSQADQACAGEAKAVADIWGITDADKTITECTQALGNDPNNDSARGRLVNAYYIRGLTFESRGENAQAAEDYSMVIKYMPSYLFIFDKRGMANVKAGNYAQAIEDFKHLVQLYPDENQLPDRLQNYTPKSCLANAYYQRGCAYNNKNDYARAVADFEKALEIKPDDSEVRELCNMVKAKM